MRNLLFFWIFILAQVGLYAQTQGIAYTAVGKGVATTFLTDYPCLGINTSALGWGSGYEKKRVTMGSRVSSRYCKIEHDLVFVL